MLAGCVKQVVVEPPASVPPPVLDRDGDGIEASVDQCPDLAEDCDGFEDEDGCPDLDNDHDQIFDACDKCPQEPEDWNGYQDDDGCPDRRVIIIREELRILPQVLFRQNSASVLELSLPIIDDVAKTMVSFPDLELVRIAGHTSVPERNATALSLKRAEAVRELLVQRGVAPERLEVAGEGDAKPIAMNSTEEGRAKNRRVEFQIVRRTPPPPAPPPEAYRPERPSCPHGESTAYEVRHCK